MSILIVFPSEAFDVVFACCDWALLGSLVLVSKHVCLEVLEDASTLWQRTETFLASFIVQFIAATALAACAGMLRVQRVDRGSPLAVELWVGVILLSVKIWACAAPLDACRARPLAMSRDMRESWRGWLLDHGKVRRRGSPYFWVGAVGCEGEWLDDVRI